MIQKKFAFCIRFADVCRIEEHPERTHIIKIIGILRLREHETQLEYKDYLRNIVSFQKVLFEYERAGKLKLSPEIGMEAEALVQDGIKNLGVFHPSKPLILATDEAYFYTQSQKLLFYYHNKLIGYGLEKKVVW